MKRFKTIYKIPSYGLKAANTAVTANPPLGPFVQEFLTSLSTECNNVPPPVYSIKWTNMSSSVLAYTYTYYTPSGTMWVPADRFDIHFNPNVAWWEGQCSDLPVSYFDLKSTIMHEVLHGLGYLSTIGANKEAFPTNFDLFLEDRNRQPAVVGNYYQGFFGDGVYIDNVRIYNPYNYNSGSSFSHADGHSKLMSWSQARGSCQQQIDDDTKIVLNRLGYDCITTTPLRDRDMPPLKHEEGDDLTVVFIVVGLVFGIVIGVVVYIYKCRGGRKKRNLEKDALLSNMYK